MSGCLFYNTFIAFSPLLPLRVQASRDAIRSHGRVCRRSLARPARQPHMSGVNGGIDYEINLDVLPTALAKRVRYVQGGPDSPTELIEAAREIAAASGTIPEILPVLVDMLGFNNPVAANIAIDALVRAGDVSIPSLLSGVAAFNYAVNAYALRALGRIGNASVLDVCIACAEKGPIPGVRRAACRALSGLVFHDMESAQRAFDVLITLADSEPDWGVRYAAIVALECFASWDALAGNSKTTALRVLEAAAAGLSNAVTENVKNEQSEKGEELCDPTVIARATIALEALTRSKSLSPS